ncbi:MAG: DUF84 family protein [Candidatus Acetothermia bacterium]|nr:DUF84 family protein [Candidatus Bipolaricaulota bacterium]
MEKIKVGSKNPVKYQAAREAFDLVGWTVEVESLDVDSGVSDQPTSDSEAIEGAITRARNVLRYGGDGLGVGLEGSTHDTAYGMFLTGWGCILKDDGSRYLGGGGRLKLPESIARRLRDGEELGPIMDEVTGEEEVKKGPGAIGIFTKGVITRTTAYRNALIFAMAEMLRPDLYQDR